MHSGFYMVAYRCITWGCVMALQSERYKSQCCRSGSAVGFLNGSLHGSLFGSAIVTALQLELYIVAYRFIIHGHSSHGSAVGALQVAVLQ